MATLHKYLHSKFNIVPVKYFLVMFYHVSVRLKTGREDAIDSYVFWKTIAIMRQCIRNRFSGAQKDCTGLFHDLWTNGNVYNEKLCIFYVYLV